MPATVVIHFLQSKPPSVADTRTTDTWQSIEWRGNWWSKPSMRETGVSSPAGSEEKSRWIGEGQENPDPPTPDHLPRDERRLRQESPLFLYSPIK